MNTKPKLRKLGDSDLSVSPVGLGCWQFSRGKGLIGNYWKSLDDTEIRNIIEASFRCF